jgi:hypothetical protein
LEGKLADSKRRLEQFASENNELSKELALVKEQHEISIKIAEKEVAALLEAKEKGLQQEKEQLAIELKTLQISHSELKKNLFATEEDLKEQRSNLERTRRQSEVETFQFQKKTNQEKSRLMEDLMKANLEAIDLKSKLTELQVSQEKEKRTYSQRLSELENEWQNKLTTVQLEFTRLSADHNRLKKHAAILEDELAESKILHQNVETAIVNLLKNISLEISKINSNDQLQMSCNAPESLPFSPFVALARVFDSFKIMIGLYNDCDSNLEAHKKRLAQTEKNYDILSLTAEKLKQSISITQASEKELIGKLESEYGAKIAAERINDDFFVLIEKFIAETPLHTDEIIKMQGKNFLGDDNVKGLVQIGELCKILHNSVGTVPVFTQIWKNFLIDNGGRSISKRFEKVIDQILLVVDQSLKTPVDIVRHTARAIESVAEKSIVDLTKLEKQLVAKAEESELVKAMVEGVNRDILLVNKLIAILESSHLTLIKLSMQDLDQNTCNAIQNSLKKLDDVPKRELGIANSTTPADLTQAPLMAKIAFEKLSDLIITERNLWRNFSDASNSLLDRHRTEINRLRTALSETTVHAKKMNDFLRENISASIAFRAFQETISMLNQERSITDVMRVEIFKKTEDAYRKNFDELLVDLNALKAFVIKVLRENERLEKEIAYQQLETSRQSRKDADKQLAELRVLFRIKGRLP